MELDALWAAPIVSVKTQNARSLVPMILGLGFTMLPEAAHALVARDGRNRDVLFEYLNGQDLNTSPSITGSRWVINFFDWHEERARQYVECFEIVEELVKPERQRRKPDGSFVLRKPLPERYWMYAEKRPGLYRAIAGMSRVICRALTSKHHVFAFVTLPLVIDQTAPVLVYDDYFHFGALQSGLHESWWRRWGVDARTRIRYTPSDVFETFPQPTYVHGRRVCAAGRSTSIGHRS